MKKGVAIGGLILVTVIWGGGFVASDMALESMITAREELKRVFALTGRKPVPAAMTGLEIPMGEQESSITYHTVWEPITFFPDTGNLPPISGWPGGPPTCMSCTAMGMNSDQECLSEGIRS